jgi:hypothetical protein
VRIALSLLLAAALVRAPTATAATDTRPLTANERATFEKLLCDSPTMQGKELACTALREYPRGTVGATLSLNAITYGSFSRAGADEAYLSYGSSVEPHSNNNGGGVLLARSGEAWRLVKWYPGELMDNCLALPGAGQTKMLCLAGWTGQGETDTSLLVKEMPFERDVAVLSAQDDRDTGSDIMCGDLPAAPMLLSIDALKRSGDPAAFAVALLTYATAKDAASACAHGGFTHVRTNKGEATIVIERGHARAIVPLRFAPSDQ